MDWSTRLIQIYLYCCEHYKSSFSVHCQRMSNNFHPDFTDEEVASIYLFGIIQGRKTIKEVYVYTRDHLHDWFPNLPSYVAYIQRLNHLEALLPAMIEQILAEASSLGVLWKTRLLDSMPIVIAKAKRSAKAKVARHFANKGYCASKGIYYYGAKLHILGLKRQGTLPIPDYVGLTPAGDHDLPAFKIIASALLGGEVYADKAYIDELLNRNYSAIEQKDFTRYLKKSEVFALMLLIL